MMGMAQSSPIVKGVIVLEGVDEGGDVGLVQAAVAVGDEFQGQGVDPRQAVERAALDLGQQLVVAARQVGADLEEGLGNDVESCRAAIRRRGRKLSPRR